MRRVLFIAMVALVVLAGLIPATAASAGEAPRVRYYEGPTSEGGRLRISVVISDGVARLTWLLIDGPYRCEDGTEGEVETGAGWGHDSPVIADHQLDLSENWEVIAFMVSGRIGANRGSGTLTFLLPALTADEQAQVCTMGELSWTVERTDGEGFPITPTVLAQRGGRTIRMPMVTSRSEGTAAPAQADDRSIRHYRGRTSQGLPMAAQTSRNDTGIALLDLSWEWVLLCDDGSEDRGGGNPLVYFEATVVMPPGRLDLDFGPVPTLDLPASAFHLHGELDAHSGSGTSTMTWPLITEDLQAQLCTTGDQTWELWRTDAGY